MKNLVLTFLFFLTASLAFGQNYDEDIFKPIRVLAEKDTNLAILYEFVLEKSNHKITIVGVYVTKDSFVAIAHPINSSEQIYLYQFANEKGYLGEFITRIEISMHEHLLLLEKLQNLSSN